jgi:hypothetical protein
LEGGVPERQRKDLISAIVNVVRSEPIPGEVRAAALTLVGWLARRARGERPCTCGIDEARRHLTPLRGGQR